MDAIARMLPSLLVIVGALLLLRHWAQRHRVSGGQRLRVITRTGVTKGAVVAVVALGERRLLVGASEHGVSLLTELDPEEEATDDDVPGTEPAGGLARRRELLSLLAGARRGRPRSPVPESTTGPRMAPLDRLRRMTVRRTVPSHPRRPEREPHRT